MTKFLMRDGRASTEAVKLGLAIEEALKAAPPNAPAVRLHLKTYGGSARSPRVVIREHNAAVDVLRAAGIAFTPGNDAPRGSAIGDFIELNRSAAERLARIIRAAN